MGQYDNRPYEVGKGKPPKEHCWQKGQSGNPRGRRPQRLNQLQPDASFSDMLAEALEEVVEVNIGNKAVRMTKKQAVARQIVNDALTGSALQRRKVLDSLLKHGAFNAAFAPQEHSIPDERIEAFIHQLAAEALNDQEREEWMRENGLARPVNNPVG